jgi:hypothetical protein
MDRIVEALDTPVTGSYDVVVLGCGIAGIAAAVAARRNGASVLVVEKTVFPGGLATTGLITYYEPICDGRGNRVIGGLAEEFLHLTYRYGATDLDPKWKEPGSHPEVRKRYESRFNAQSFILGLDEVLEDAGATVWFDTAFCRPVVNDSVIEQVVVENKSGRQAVEAGVVIDATGDADCLHRAGVPCIVAENWLVLSSKIITLEGAARAVEAGDIHKAMRGLSLGGTRLGENAVPGKPKYRSVEATDVNDFVIESRRLMRERMRKNDHKEMELVTLPAMAQFRTTRRLAGEYTLREEDEGRSFEDSIGAICDFSRRGPVYEVPFRCLVSADYPNLITCGRSLSAEGHAWEVARVIPPAALTGEAAGTAAAMAGRRGWPSLSLQELQSRLAGQGVLIHAPAAVAAGDEPS